MLHCSIQRLSRRICKHCDNTHYIYFSSHLHLRLHHLKQKLPFAISSLRDGLDAKMWGEAWERDLKASEQETSETGAKKAYATLVPDQVSNVNCFIFPFLQSSLHLCSLCHFLHSTIPFQNKPSLPRIFEEIRQRSSRGIPKPYRLCWWGCWFCRSFGKQQFQSTQSRTCFERNGKRNRTCKYTCYRRDYKKNWRQSRYSWCPNWAPRLQPPVLVVYVHGSPGSLLAAPLAQQANLSIKLCKISFKVC